MSTDTDTDTLREAEDFLQSIASVVNFDVEEEDEEDEPLPNYSSTILDKIDDISDAGDENISPDSQNIPSDSISLALLMIQNADFDMEEEEEDEPIPIFELEKVVDLGSAEFIEAQRIISNDVWNVNAWITLVEEVEIGRGGDMTVIDAYQRFLLQFPRSGRFWRLLADYYIQREEFSNAEEVFRKSLYKCRCIGLWQSYLTMTKKKTVDKCSKYSETYQKEKEYLRLAFDKALENIGMSPDSNVLWRQYVDFVNDWPEVGDLDKGRKLKSLREIYQRAICTPMEDLDTFWKEYESIEKQAGEHLAAQLLPEFQPKHLHAKAIFNERKKLNAGIALDRLAVPPAKTLSEIQQLSLWNKWLSFESGNPENLPPEAYKEMMTLVYDQCKCCMRYHAEIWMSFARFQQRVAGVAETRAAYREAIEIIPSLATLRLALAELEERQGAVDVARDVLKQAFIQLPSAFTFAALQRFLRRMNGVVAARQCFSDTLPLRSDGTLGFLVYISHAQLELEVNHQPQVALRVMQLAVTAHPEASLSPAYVKLAAKILLQIGDLNQLRITFHIALGITASSSSSTSSTSSFNPDTTSSKAIVPTSVLSARERLELWEDYLNAEMQLGLSNAVRLDELRSYRNAAKTVLEDSERGLSATAAALLSDDKLNAVSAASGIYESSVELLERYGGLSSALPVADNSLKERLRSVALHSDDSRFHRYDDEDRGGGGAEGMRRKLGGGGAKRDADTMAADAISLTLPPFLRDLISRLPAHSGPPPAIDAVIEQLRRAVLPPRPNQALEEAGASVTGSEGEAVPLGGATATSGSAALDGFGDGGGGRLDPFHQSTGSGGGGGGYSDGRMDVDDYYEGPEETAAAAALDRDDLFRQRQRSRFSSASSSTAY